MSMKNLRNYMDKNAETRYNNVSIQKGRDIV